MIGVTASVEVNVTTLSYILTNVAPTVTPSVTVCELVTMAEELFSRGVKIASTMMLSSVGPCLKSMFVTHPENEFIKKFQMETYYGKGFLNIQD